MPDSLLEWGGFGCSIGLDQRLGEMDQLSCDRGGIAGEHIWAVAFASGGKDWVRHSSPRVLTCYRSLHRFPDGPSNSGCGGTH